MTITVTKPIKVADSSFCRPLPLDNCYVISSQHPIGILTDEELDFVVSETDGIESWERGQPGDEPDSDKTEEFFDFFASDRQNGAPCRSVRVKTCARTVPPHDHQLSSLQAFAQHAILRVWEASETEQKKLRFPDYNWQPVLPGFAVRLWESPGDCVLRFPCPVRHLKQDWLDDVTEVVPGIRSLVHDSDLHDEVLRLQLEPYRKGSGVPDLALAIRKLLVHLPELVPTGRSPLSPDALTLGQLQPGMWVEVQNSLTSTLQTMSTLGSIAARLLVACVDPDKEEVMLVNPAVESSKKRGNWHDAAGLGLTPYSNEPLDWHRYYYLVPVA
jgi:hypothetical protein